MKNKEKKENTDYTREELFEFFLGNNKETLAEHMSCNRCSGGLCFGCTKGK